MPIHCPAPPCSLPAREGRRGRRGRRRPIRQSTAYGLDLEHEPCAPAPAQTPPPRPSKPGGAPSWRARLEPDGARPPAAEARGFATASVQNATHGA
ncbi:MAG: hypothetical protein MZW92_17265 [Comamonadaceae bacterium]|nr:hypothetical protein [Comamonadaceae bacterium]